MALGMKLRSVSRGPGQKRPCGGTDMLRRTKRRGRERRTRLKGKPAAQRNRPYVCSFVRAATPITWATIFWRRRRNFMIGGKPMQTRLCRRQVLKPSYASCRLTCITQTVEWMKANGFEMTVKQVKSLWGRMIKKYAAIKAREEHTGGGDGDAEV